MNLATPIHDFLDALVHPAARENPLTAERHLAFMVPRLFASLVALGGLPVFLAVRGVPTALEFFVLAWMIAPISTACFLSRTGRYDAAQGLSALAVTCVVTVVAANSGGISSFAVMWLILIPLEAALSGSRRVVAVAAVLAIGGAALLILAGWAFHFGHTITRATGVPAAVFGIMSALLYATGIAFGAASLGHADFAGAGRKAERCPPDLGAIDVITYHGHGGRIIRASANTQTVLGVAACDARNYGLFDRIHIADRPAYLHALSETAATGDTCEIEFRLRRDDQPTFIWIEMRCRPLDRNIGRDVAGPRVVAVMRDITLRKSRQEALVAARADAERANTAKSRFLAIISDELRTPLNALIGFSDMLRNEAENRGDGPRRRDYARLINESGHDLLAVVNEIHDMSRLDTSDFARRSILKGLSGGPPMSGHAADPSTSEQAAINPPANLSFPVQRRA